MKQIELEPSEVRASSPLTARERRARTMFLVWLAALIASPFLWPVIGDFSSIGLAVIAAIGVGANYARWVSEPIFQVGGIMKLAVYAGVFAAVMVAGTIIRPFTDAAVDWLRALF